MNHKYNHHNNNNNTNENTTNDNMCTDIGESAQQQLVAAMKTVQLVYDKIGTSTKK